MLIIASFLLCNTPNIFRIAGQAYTGDVDFYYGMLSDELDSETADMLVGVFSDISFFLPILNSILDPLIYGTRMKSIRKAIRETFKGNIPTETEPSTRPTAV